ncbi:unnamed protein product [Amoebophrya sp. A120]|nr:unnamed protein product [Amoebophrya sp. A120]|eukprot:GSA120T00002379001.1
MGTNDIERRILRIPLVDTTVTADERADFAASFRFELLPDDVQQQAAHLRRSLAQERELQALDQVSQKQHNAPPQDSGSGADEVFHRPRELFCVNVFQLGEHVLERINDGAVLNSGDVVPFLRPGSTSQIDDNNLLLSNENKLAIAAPSNGDEILIRRRATLAALSSGRLTTAQNGGRISIKDLGIRTSALLDDEGARWCRQLTLVAEFQNPSGMQLSTHPSTGSNSRRGQAQAQLIPVAAAHHCVPLDVVQRNPALVFEVAPRPKFTVGLNPAPAMACSTVKRQGQSSSSTAATTRLLGMLQYYRLPEVRFLPSLLQVPVRTFLNPGWTEWLPLECDYCLPGQAYRITVRELDISFAHCAGDLSLRQVGGSDPPLVKTRLVPEQGSSTSPGNKSTRRAISSVSSASTSRRTDTSNGTVDQKMRRLGSAGGPLHPLFDLGRDWMLHCELRNPCSPSHSQLVHQIKVIGDQPRPEGKSSEKMTPAGDKEKTTSSSSPAKDLQWILNPRIQLSKVAAQALLPTDSTSKPSDSETFPSWTSYGHPRYVINGDRVVTPKDTSSGSKIFKRYYEDHPAGGMELLFPLESGHRMDTRERRRWLHRRLVVCFQPDADLHPDVGFLIGYAAFHGDARDTEAFVFGIVFLAILLPLVCIVSMVLHRQKCVNLAKRHKAVRFWMERQRLQEELIAVRDMREEMDSPPSTSPASSNLEVE